MKDEEVLDLNKSCQPYITPVDVPARASASINSHKVVERGLRNGYEEFSLPLVFCARRTYMVKRVMVPVDANESADGDMNWRSG